MILSKKQARNEIRAIRRSLSPDYIRAESEKILRRLIDSSFFRAAPTVFCYAAVGGEVDTFPLMEEVLRQGKTLALPRVRADGMDFYRVDDLRSLENGYRNIPEPCADAEKRIPGEHDLIVMPGVAFDRKKHRVGYGGGFYDRYLARCPLGKRVAPAFSFQMLEALEQEESDVSPNVIILPDRIFD